MEEKKLERSTSDRMVSGVAGGLAKYFGIDSTIVRIAFFLLAWFGGGGVLVYLVLWLVMPEEGSDGSIVDGMTSSKNNGGGADVG